MKVHTSMVLSPHLKVSKYGDYQEAWYLLRGKGKLIGLDGPM